MKHFHNYLPSTLLLAYTVYSAFIQINIAHSIILASLAGLFAYTQLLQRQTNTSQIKEELRQFTEKWEKEVSNLKESHDKQLSNLEAEMGRVQLIVTPKSVSAPQGNANRPILKF